MVLLYLSRPQRHCLPSHMQPPEPNCQGQAHQLMVSIAENDPLLEFESLHDRNRWNILPSSLQQIEAFGRSVLNERPCLADHGQYLYHQCEMLSLEWSHPGQWNSTLMHHPMQNHRSEHHRRRRRRRIFDPEFYHGQTEFFSDSVRRL